MSAPVFTTHPMTVDEFLLWDDGTDARYELIDGIPVPKHAVWVHGRPVAHAAPVNDHAAVVLNLGAELRAQVRAPCRVYAGAGLRLPGRDDMWLEPDVQVSCAKSPPGARGVTDPVLLAEVLSPSTRRYDKDRKLAQYCSSLPSVEAVLQVEVDRPEIRCVRRVGERWEIEFLRGLDAAVVFPALGVTLPLAEVYRGVAFE